MYQNNNNNNCYYAIPWVEDPRRKIRFFKK